MSSQLLPVRELADQIRGVSYAKEDASPTPRDGAVAVLRAGNIQDASVVLDDLVYVPRTRIAPEQLLRRHDVLVATSSGSVDVVGKAAQVTKDLDAAFGAFCKVVRPKKSIEPRYFAHYFRTAEYRQTVSKLAAGVNINNLRNEHLDDLLLPVPTPAEQRRIADVLDKADAIRRKRREAIALTEELLRSTFLELFGDPVANPKRWDVKPLGELVSAIDSGWSPTCLSRVATPDEWGVLKLGALTSGTYLEGENKALGPEQSPRPELEVRPGDVLFSRKNTYEHIAACVLVSHTRPCLMMPDLVFRLVPAKEGLASMVLWAVLSHPTKRAQVQSLAGGTSGSMPNISKERLRTVLLPVPPPSLQRRFAEIIAHHTALREAALESSRSTEDLFSSLVARSFDGDVTRGELAGRSQLGLFENERR